MEECGGGGRPSTKGSLAWDQVTVTSDANGCADIDAFDVGLTTAFAYNFSPISSDCEGTAFVVGSTGSQTVTATESIRAWFYENKMVIICPTRSFGSAPCYLEASGFNDPAPPTDACSTFDPVPPRIGMRFGLDSVNVVMSCWYSLTEPADGFNVPFANTNSLNGYTPLEALAQVAVESCENFLLRSEILGVTRTYAGAICSGTDNAWADCASAALRIEPLSATGDSTRIFLHSGAGAFRGTTDRTDVYSMFISQGITCTWDGRFYVDCDGDYDLIYTAHAHSGCTWDGNAIYCENQPVPLTSTPTATPFSAPTFAPFTSTPSIAPMSTAASIMPTAAPMVTPFSTQTFAPMTSTPSISPISTAGSMMPTAQSGTQERTFRPSMTESPRDTEGPSLLSNDREGALFGANDDGSSTFNGALVGGLAAAGLVVLCTAVALFHFFCIKKKPKGNTKELAPSVTKQSEQTSQVQKLVDSVDKPFDSMASREIYGERTPPIPVPEATQEEQPTTQDEAALGPEETYFVDV